MTALLLELPGLQLRPASPRWVIQPWALHWVAARTCRPAPQPTIPSGSSILGTAEFMLVLRNTLTDTLQLYSTLYSILVTLCVERSAVRGLLTCRVLDEPERINQGGRGDGGTGRERAVRPRGPSSLNATAPGVRYNRLYDTTGFMIQPASPKSRSQYNHADLRQDTDTTVALEGGGTDNHRETPRPSMGIMALYLSDHLNWEIGGGWGGYRMTPNSTSIPFP